MPSRFAAELIDLLPRLRRLAVALTGNASEADDLVQAACEKAIRAQKQWDPDKRLDLWLFAIMRNLWIDAIRKRRREMVVGFAEEVDTAGEDGRAVLEARLGLADVASLLETLPEDQRTVLLMVCRDGLSYQSVAAATGVPIGTVMSRLSRARRRLTALLHPVNPQVTETEDRS
jgi:RNA polymerase sigma-70 factor (ECF subfamily)